MQNLNEIAHSDIQSLDARQLTDLLRLLLFKEAFDRRISETAVSVCLDINTPDGGEDGHIVWECGPEPEGFLPSRNILFQCKVKDMPPTDCGKELLTKDAKQLKPMIKDVLDHGGTYVLFFARSCNESGQRLRLERMRDALLKVSFPDAENVPIFIYDSNRIAAWVNRHPSIMTWVALTIKSPRISGLQVWSSWSRYPHFRFEFADSERLAEYRAAIQQCSVEPNSVLRITGPPTVGKSRLVLEAFRPSVEDHINLKEMLLAGGRSANVLFYDASQESGQIVDYIVDVANSGLRGVLVVDNCAPDCHARLAQEVRKDGSGLSIVTIDCEGAGAERTILLDPTNQKGMVVQLLKSNWPRLSSGEVDRIAEFSEGFPGIAVPLAEALEGDLDNYTLLPDKDILEKLLKGRSGVTDNARNVIRWISIFAHVKYCPPELNPQAQLVARLARVAEDEFVRECQRFEGKGILRRRGDYVLVVPRPLALHLADEWWSSQTQNSLKQCIPDIVQAGLLESMCKQIEYLGFSPKAREFATEVCGPHGPFDSTAIFNSESLSRLFMHLGVLVPLESSNTLLRIVQGMTKEELVSGRRGRRNIMWLLEKLAFRSESFESAVQVLCRLAVAENESYVNNATSQFCQLFHVFLPGTEVGLRQRLDSIDVLLDAADTGHITIVVKALCAALSAGYFSRSGGSENQGSLPELIDYKPRNYAEIWDYWRGCFDRLLALQRQHPEIRQLVLTEVGNKLGGLVQGGCPISDLRTVVKTLASHAESVWPAAEKSLRWLLSYEEYRSNVDLRKELESWLDLLKPKTMDGRLLVIVKDPPNDFIKDQEGDYKSLSGERAFHLGQELAHDPNLQAHMGPLLEGVVKEAVPFASGVAERHPNPRGFAHSCLEILRQVSSERGNPELLSFFLQRVAQSAITSECVKTMLVEDALTPYLPRFLAHVSAGYQDFVSFLHAVREGKAPVQSLRYLQSPDAFDQLSLDEVVKLSEEIIALGTEGSSAAFDILFMRAMIRKDEQPTILALIRRFLESARLVDIFLSPECLQKYQIKEAVKKLLDEAEKGVEFAEHLSRSLTTACASRDFAIDAAFQLNEIICLLLTKYPERVWPILSEGLLSNDLARWHLAELLGHGIHYFAADDVCTCPIMCLPDAFLLQWCRENAPEAAVFVAGIYPTNADRLDANEIHPLVCDLIAEFGNSSDLLDALQANLNTFGWAGSLVPRWRHVIEILTPLKSHPKPRVRKWIERQIKAAEVVTEQERREDAHRNIGIYRQGRSEDFIE